MAAKKATDPSEQFGEGADPEEDARATEAEGTGGTDGDEGTADPVEPFDKAALARDDSAHDDSAGDDDVDHVAHGGEDHSPLLRSLADAHLDESEPADDADDLDDLDL